MAENDQPNFDLGFFRFASTTEEKAKNILSERSKESTQRATKGAIKALREYIEEKSYDKILEEIEDKDLPDLLYNFYTDLRKAKGGQYKLQSLKCIRAGLNRYMKVERNIDIIKDVRFTKSNEMFLAVSKQTCRAGLGTTKSYPPIEPEDLAKVAEYFTHDMMNAPNAKKIQKAVLFNIIYFFCRRGRENIYDFTHDMFALETDPDGTQYVYQAKGEKDKNHGVDRTSNPNDGHMYEQADCQLCPVSLFKLYRSKIHQDIPFLWQRPKQGILHWNDKLWYDRVRVGRESLEGFMASLSAEANLSKRYTNHSIRSTVMGILGEKFEGRIVIGLSGHKSENTVKQYICRLPTKTKREVCQELAVNILPKVPKKDTPKPAATISTPPKESDAPEENAVQIPQDLQQIQLDPDLQQPNVEYYYEEFNAPIDPQLENFLSQFDAVDAVPATNQAPAQLPPPMPVPAPVPAPNETQIMPQIPQQNLNMNVNNIQNNQQHPMLPAMYFPSSNVTINYNFGK